MRVEQSTFSRIAVAAAAAAATAAAARARKNPQTRANARTFPTTARTRAVAPRVSSNRRATMSRGARAHALFARASRQTKRRTRDSGGGGWLDRALARLNSAASLSPTAHRDRHNKPSLERRAI